MHNCLLFLYGCLDKALNELKTIAYISRKVHVYNSVCHVQLNVCNTQVP